MRATTCHRCGARVLRILDDDGIEATVDAANLTPAGEAIAVLTGRKTWNVRRTRRVGTDIWRRRPAHIGKDLGGTVHADHACHAPIPAAWIVTPPPPTTTAQEIPF